MFNPEILNRISSRLVGLAQATGVAAYVLLFALIVTNSQHVVPNGPAVLGIMFFLIAFIFSALLCGSLVLGYPILLALRGQLKRAVSIVMWTGISLVMFLVLVVIVLITFK